MPQLRIEKRLAHCRDLRVYIKGNLESIANYGLRYSSDQPISSSRAEGCFKQIDNAKMGKFRGMRRSPKGANRVAVFRAAMLDERLPNQVLGYGLAV